jgi:hypothetical protein
MSVTGWSDPCDAWTQPAAFAGCVDAPGGALNCLFVVTYANPPGSIDCWVFPDACIPTSWVPGCTPYYGCGTGP